MQQEQLPVIIEPMQPLKVLILSDSPDFETKFLKEWLGSNGYSVASRSTITKGKSGQDYINIDQVDLTKLNPLLLAKFDLVIGDLSVLKNLSPPENSALQNEVTQKGLGLIIRADSSNKNALWLQSNFPVMHEPGKQPIFSPLNILGSGKTAPLNLDPDFVTAQSNTQALVTDQHNQMLSGLTINGSGKLVFTTIHNSYTWMLAGDQKDYNALWSLPIDKVARKRQSAEHWSVASSLPLVGQPATLVAESGVPLTNVFIDKTTVYPAQNAAVPFQQSFTYWPSAYGWQQVAHSNVAPFWWYVWDNTAWRTLRAAKKIGLNAQLNKPTGANLSSSTQNQQKIRAVVPKIYFYILFLMAVTFLWAESKFYN